MYLDLDKGNFGFPCVVYAGKFREKRCAGEAQK